MKIFIINLKRASERKVLMQRQFEKMNYELKLQFEIIFFDAIDAKAGEHLAFKQYSERASIIFRGKEMSDGERACFASHYSLWQKCVELNEPIVILEDDMTILERFWEKLTHISQSEYVYVRLMFLEEQVKAFMLTNGFYATFDKITGTQGYYLTPKGAQGFLNSAKTWYCPVDDYMGMFYIHHIPSVCIKPVLEEMEIETTIAGRWSKPPLPLKIVRECSRLYFQFKRLIFLSFNKRSLLMPKEALESIRGGV